jgi:hypothetical protein
VLFDLRDEASCVAPVCVILLLPRSSEVRVFDLRDSASCVAPVFVI